MFFYLYPIVDIGRRKIVGREVHERESADPAAVLIRQAVLAEGCIARPLVLHADPNIPTGQLNEGRHDEGDDGLCCTNPVRDSSGEFSMVAGRHEQTHTPRLQDQELAGLQCSAQAPWLAGDLV